MNILKDKIILITAGPTYEPIDPVRFIGNRSSGKMGYALALSLAAKGAKVNLVSGPTHLEIAHPNIILHSVQTAAEMYDTCHELFPYTDIAILAAAVADYTIASPAQQKIKKKGETLTLDLVKTKDILYSLGQIKENRVLVGFALETNNEENNARKKLKKKNLDFIILNSLADAGAGFGHDTNKITIFDKYNNLTKFELKSKQEVAQDIVLYLKNYIENSCV